MNVGLPMLVASTTSRNAYWPRPTVIFCVFSEAVFRSARIKLELKQTRVGLCSALHAGKCVAAYDVLYRLPHHGNSIIECQNHLESHDALSFC